MMFLIRTAFWLGVVIMLIPVEEDPAGQVAPVRMDVVGALEAAGAAQVAIADLGGFCERNPSACDIGERLATTFALKARTGARLVTEFIDDKLAGADAPAAVGHGTLTPADLEPEWRGPAGDKAGSA